MRQEISRLRAALHKVAYDPFGVAEASDRDVLDAITVFARAELEALSEASPLSDETSGYSQAYADQMREALMTIATSSLTPDRVRQFAHKGLLPPSGSSQKAKERCLHKSDCTADQYKAGLCEEHYLDSLR